MSNIADIIEDFIKSGYNVVLNNKYKENHEILEVFKDSYKICDIATLCKNHLKCSNSKCIQWHPY